METSKIVRPVLGLEPNQPSKLVNIEPSLSQNIRPDNSPSLPKHWNLAARYDQWLRMVAKMAPLLEADSTEQNQVYVLLAQALLSIAD